MNDKDNSFTPLDALTLVGLIFALGILMSVLSRCSAPTSPTAEQTNICIGYCPESGRQQ